MCTPPPTSPGWKHLGAIPPSLHSTTSNRAAATQSSSQDPPSSQVFTIEILIKQILLNLSEYKDIKSIQRLNKACREVSEDEEFDELLFRLGRYSGNFENEEYSEDVRVHPIFSLGNPLPIPPSTPTSITEEKTSKHPSVLQQSAFWPPMKSLFVVYTDSHISGTFRTPTIESGYTVNDLMECTRKYPLSFWKERPYILKGEYMGFFGGGWGFRVVDARDTEGEWPAK